MGAGRGARFVTAIGAVAVIVVNLGDGDFVQRVRDAGILGIVLIELCDWVVNLGSDSGP